MIPQEPCVVLFCGGRDCTMESHPTGGPGTRGMIKLLCEAGIPHVVRGAR